ncbi:MAG: hypothetical protein NTU88_06675 [Armatimonadetes bacterium]|nr:hypothetical protein [Armatimonadota bacterium]
MCFTHERGREETRWYTQGTNRSTQAKWRVYYDGGMQESRVNEQLNGGRWNLFASDRPFVVGTSGCVGTYSDTGDTSTMAIIADAVKLVYKGDTEPPIAATIAEAKNLRDDTVAILLDKVVSAGFGDHFYICESKEDQVSGIRVNGDAPPEGSSVDLSAVLDTLNGERVLTLPSVQPEDGPGVPRPIFMSNKWVGGGELNTFTGGVTGGAGVNNLGLLIVLCGKVTQIGNGYLYVNDGSDLRDGTPTGEEENVGIRVICNPSGYDAGDILEVTGTSSCFESSPGHVARRILARGPADVRMVYRQPAP